MFVRPDSFKECLIKYQLPIITGIYLPKNFHDSSESIDYDSTEISTTRGHCILVYGWNSEGYLAKNSWTDMPYLQIPFRYNQFSDSWIILE